MLKMFLMLTNLIKVSFVPFHWHSNTENRFQVFLATSLPHRPPIITFSISHENFSHVETQQHKHRWWAIFSCFTHTFSPRLFPSVFVCCENFFLLVLVSIKGGNLWAKKTFSCLTWMNQWIFCDFKLLSAIEAAIFIFITSDLCAVELETESRNRRENRKQRKTRGAIFTHEITKQRLDEKLPQPTANCKLHFDFIFLRLSKTRIWCRVSQK